MASPNQLPNSVFAVLDHEDRLMAVFATRAAAEAYVRSYGSESVWPVEEHEVRDEHA